MNRKVPLKVDFFCIGAPRSGTTWLYHCLNEHPRITLSKYKEPNFFARKLGPFDSQEFQRFMKDWNWYASLFDHKRNGDIIGEFSINLLHNIPEAPILISKHFPEAKFIVILREPVARTYSHYWHDKRYQRNPRVPGTFEEALENPDLLFQSTYYDQLKVWLGFFPKVRFYFILDFELKSDPLSILRSLSIFLGVEPDFRPSSLDRKVNPATKRHHLYFISLDVSKWARNNGLGLVVDALKWTGVHRLMERVLVHSAAYPPMNQETEHRLRDYFLPDIEKLEGLIGRKLDAWKT